VPTCHTSRSRTSTSKPDNAWVAILRLVAQILLGALCQSRVQRNRQVELRGFEPLTPWLQTRCSAN
jgi:hypothetical protein